MSRGGARANSGPLPGTRYVKAKPIARVPKDVLTAARKSGMTPLDFMLTVMNDEEQDMTLRARMAMAAAPFVHAKKSEAAVGKKEAAEAAAKEAGAGSEWGNDLVSISVRN